MSAVTYAEVARLCRHEPGSELVLTTRKAGFENTGHSTVQAYECRRKRCPRTYRGQWNFACRECWNEINLRSRKLIHEVISWLTVNPNDEGAKRCREAFIAIASRDWEPAPVPMRTDEPDGVVRERVFVGRSRR